MVPQAVFNLSLNAITVCLSLSLISLSPAPTLSFYPPTSGLSLSLSLPLSFFLSPFLPLSLPLSLRMSWLQLIFV